MLGVKKMSQGITETDRELVSKARRRIRARKLRAIVSFIGSVALPLIIYLNLVHEVSWLDEAASKTYFRPILLFGMFLGVLACIEVHFVLQGIRLAFGKNSSDQLVVRLADRLEKEETENSAQRGAANGDSENAPSE